jgi:hypothetical protein
MTNLGDTMAARFKWIFVVSLAIVSIAVVLYINGSIFYLITTKQLASDMPLHIIDAKLVVENRVEVIYKVSIGSKVNIDNPKENGRYRPQPHPMFHYALITTKNIFQLYSYEIAWWYTMMIAQIITLILTTYIVMSNIQRTTMALPISMILASLLFIVSSLYIPWYSPKMYMGFLNSNIYHNSTSIVSKPIAYVTILAMAAWLSPNNQTINWKLIICTNILVVFSTLAKPNIPLAVIPAWAVCIALRFITDEKKHYLQYALYLLPIIITALIMYIQAQIRFSNTFLVGISWLYVAQSWTPNPFVSIMLTVAFPTSVVLFYPHTIRNTLFQLTIISFVIAVFTYLVFYEIENNATSKFISQNFGWGARMIGGFFFALASAELVNAYHRLQSKIDYVKFGTATLLLLGHIISGTIYTIRLYSARNPFF